MALTYIEPQEAPLLTTQVSQGNLSQSVCSIYWRLLTKFQA